MYASFGNGIAVLCGGPGGEREVSLVSGKQVHGSLVRSGVPARLVVIPGNDPESFLNELDCSLAVMMLHGDFGEDGVAQAILERRGIPFSGSGSAACRLSMDKTATKNVMRGLGIPTPASVLLTSAERAAEVVAGAGIRYPLFVKPNAKGSSVGASRVENEGGLVAAVAGALGTGDAALVEELIVGREFTLGWLDGKLLPLIEMVADGAFYDYHAKYASDKTRYVCPAEIPADTAARICGDAARLLAALGMRDTARVDVMLRGSDGEPFFLEANALPGFTSHSLLPMAAAATGVGMDALCLSLLEMAAKRGDATK
jgi:D-alanine-D-alanine ligase